MNEPKSIDDIMPSAAPTDDGIRRWQALPVEEQRKRLEKALEVPPGSLVKNAFDFLPDRILFFTVKPTSKLK